MSSGNFEQLPLLRTNVRYNIIIFNTIANTFGIMYRLLRTFYFSTRYEYFVLVLIKYKLQILQHNNIVVPVLSLFMVWVVTIILLLYSYEILANNKNDNVFLLKTLSRWFFFLLPSTDKGAKLRLTIERLHWLKVVQI